MKCLLILSLTICLVKILPAQSYNEYQPTDYIIQRIPLSETHTTTDIARYIATHFKTAQQKVRAAYTWVTHNIKYSTDSMYSINWGGDDERKVTAALRRRKGVCENYAAIFNELLLKSGIPSFVVSGFVNMNGAVNRAGHSWCAVQLGNQWLFCDPTWDEGFLSTTKYFLIIPETFIQTHMPFDPLWQLLHRPITSLEFKKGNFYNGNDGVVFEYPDSINAFLQLNELQQLEAATRRITKAGINNNQQKNWLAYNNMKIAIHNEEDHMNLYNSAVDDFNKGSQLFNSFVYFRNSQFTPAKPDNELSTLLDPVAACISLASEKAARLSKSAKNFQYDPTELQSKLSALTQKVQDQNDFLKRYLAGNVQDRSRLFYQ